MRRRRGLLHAHHRAGEDHRLLLDDRARGHGLAALGLVLLLTLHRLGWAAPRTGCRGRVLLYEGPSIKGRRVRARADEASTGADASAESGTPSSKPKPGLVSYYLYRPLEGSACTYR